MGKRGRGQAAALATARTLVCEVRVVGRLLEWKGSYGWVQPLRPIEHLEGVKHRGKVYVAQEDISEDLPGPGACVSFLAYTDGTLSGIGAADVRAAHEEELDPEAGDGYGGGWSRNHGAYISQAAQSKGKCKGRPRRRVLTQEPLEGTVCDWRGKWGWIEPAYPLDDILAAAGFPGVNPGNLFFALDDVGEEIAGVGAPVYFFPYMDAQGVGATHVTPSRAPPPEQDKGDIYTKAHTALSESVWAAVQLTPDIEPEWTGEELRRKVTKYLNKGVTSLENLEQMPWYEAVEQFLSRAMQSYSSACGDRPWFFELDLSQAFATAAWVLVQCSSQRPPHPPREEVAQLATQGYLDRLHRCQLDKALWSAIQAIFSADSAVLHKIFSSMTRSYDTVLQIAAADSRPLKGFRRGEIFVKQWMKDSMTRAWTAVQSPETLFTEENVLRLFSNLMAPFGEDDPYSCVPRWLVPREGRPSLRFLRPAVDALFWEWAHPLPPPMKVRRRPPFEKWGDGWQEGENPDMGLGGYNMMELQDNLEKPLG